MRPRCVPTTSFLWLALALAVAPAAHAGKQDLRRDRPALRDAARQVAQEAQKQRLIAKLRSDAPVLREAREALINPLEVPLFRER